MYRSNFIACMLACLIILIPSLGAAQTGNVQISMAALKAETEKLGAPKLQNTYLYFGKTADLSDVVKAVVKTHGGVAMLFVKRGDEFVRVASTVEREDGASAFGFALDPSSPAIAKLNNGEAYDGAATVFGKTYAAGYEPIKDASGAVIGAYFVGYPK